MAFGRRRKNRGKWLLAGLAPLAAGAAWIIREAARRGRRAGRRYYPQPPGAYGLEEPAGERGEDLRIATVDPGEEFAGVPAAEGAARVPVSRGVEGQVPVTAKKRPAGATSGARRGGAQVYAVSGGESAPPSTRRILLFDEGRTAPFPWLQALILLLLLAVVTGMALFGRQTARAQVMVVPGGDPENGRQAIQSWGCGSCHTIPGVAGAHGKVGPKLEGLSERTYLAGILPNTPENMVEWIMNPQEIQPGNAMPDTDVPAPTARDMAAYLYSIR